MSWKVVLSFVGAIALAAPLLLNGTAATVGSTTLTVQDVYLFKAVKRLRAAEPGAATRVAGEELKKAVQLAVFEEMLYLELKSLAFDGGSRADAERVAKMLRQKSPKEWKSVIETYGVSDASLVDSIYKMNQVEKFLNNKVETLTPVVTDDEIQKYFTANAARFRGNSVEQLRPSIMVILKKQHAQKGLEDWVKVLQEKYRVQNQLDS